jgi:hypothetical protein
MTTIQTGIPINSPGVRQLNLGNPKQFDNTAPFDERKLTPPPSLEDRQKQLDLQNNVHQTTVIERNGDVIASFGENGWRHFQNGSDFDHSQINKTDSQVIDSLKQKYGATLSVNTYPNGQGPTSGDIFERIHGYSPPRLVDYRA